MISKFHGRWPKLRETTDDACYCQDDKEKLTEMIGQIPFMHLCRDVWVGMLLGLMGAKAPQSITRVLFCSVFVCLRRHHLCESSKFISDGSICVGILADSVVTDL